MFFFSFWNYFCFHFWFWNCWILQSSNFIFSSQDYCILCLLFIITIICYWLFSCFFVCFYVLYIYLCIYTVFVLFFVFLHMLNFYNPPITLSKIGIRAVFIIVPRFAKYIKSVILFPLYSFIYTTFEYPQFHPLKL